MARPTPLRAGVPTSISRCARAASGSAPVSERARSHYQPRGEEVAGQPLKLDQMGNTHFSFTVPDTEALLQELVAKGVPLAGPREAFTNAQGRVRSFYVHAPDDILIQFDSGLNEG
jgi:catechol 2,3-dioxygenase-like lactoylglutathione lyase family enzyme